MLWICGGLERSWAGRPVPHIQLEIKKVLTASGDGGRLDFIRTWAARLELAVLALEDVPVRTGVAHRADPLDQRRLGLQQIEGVVAIARERHFGKAVGIAMEWVRWDGCW